MKTIAQFVEDGITTLAELQEALQLAMQLEFSTIPPYLCAQWSINNDNDPSNVADMIENIVVQEMFHFALAGNMLTAIGGTPSVANAGFIPTYPTNKLPGDIPQILPVDLQPLSSNQLQVFMQIENPEFTPIGPTATPPATIGAFYDMVSAGFTTVNPTIISTACAVTMGEAVPIASIADAQAAITRIKEEGEGTTGSHRRAAGRSHPTRTLLRLQGDLRGKDVCADGWHLGLHWQPDSDADDVPLLAIARQPRSLVSVQPSALTASDRSSVLLDDKRRVSPIPTP